MKISILVCFQFSQEERHHFPTGTAAFLSNDFYFGRKLIFLLGQELQGQSQRKQNTSEALGENALFPSVFQCPFSCTSHVYIKNNAKGSVCVGARLMQAVAEQTMSNWPLFF